MTESSSAIMRNRLRNRIKSYMKRFNIDPVSELVDEDDPSDNLYELVAKHLGRQYERILAADDPNRALNMELIRNSIQESVMSYSHDQILEAAKRFPMNNSHYVNAKPILDAIGKSRAELMRSVNNPDVSIYLDQTQAARCKLIELENSIHEQTERLWHTLLACVSADGDLPVTEQDLVHHASRIKLIRLQYKEKRANVDKIRLEVVALEEDVNRLRLTLSELSKEFPDENIEHIIKHYERLGEMKTNQMEQITEQVHALNRELVQKRNILAPKLHELHQLREEVSKQGLEVEERKRALMLMNGTHDATKRPHDDFQRLKEELRQTQFEFEFLKEVLESGHKYQGLFPNLTRNDHDIVLSRLHDLSRLLKTRNCYPPSVVWYGIQTNHFFLTLGVAKNFYR